MLRSNLRSHTTIGEKRSRSQDDPCRDVQKHFQRCCNHTEGVSHTFISISTPDTNATSPDTGIVHEDVVVSEVSPHGTSGSLAHRAASVVIGVSKEAHEKWLLDINRLIETLGNIASALDATQARVKALSSGLSRIEAQLDILVRI